MSSGGQPNNYVVGCVRGSHEQWGAAKQLLEHKRVSRYVSLKEAHILTVETGSLQEHFLKQHL